MGAAFFLTVTEGVTDPGRWREWGGLGLFVVGVLNTSVLPVPGLVDALTLLLAASYGAWWPYYAAMAAAGSVVGGFLAYQVGRKGGKEALEKRFAARKVQRIYRGYDRWGVGAVMVPAMMPPPFPVMPFLLAAGAMNYSMRKYMLALATGRALRFGVVALLGSLYGRHILGFFERYKPILLYVAMAAVLLGGMAALVYFLLQRKKSAGRKQGRKAA